MILEAEFYGGATHTVLGSNGNVHRKTRVQTFEPSTGGLSVSLPSAVDLVAGTRYYIANASGTYDVDLLDGDGNAVLAITAGYGGWVALLTPGTAAGVWSVYRAGIYGDGSGTPGGNLVVDFVVSVDTMNLDVYEAAVASGWDGSTAADITCRIASGIRVGSVDVGEPSLHVSNLFPAGSTVTVFMSNARIQGAGGAGGDGGSTISSDGDDGEDGGDAVYLEWNTLITGTGSIIGGAGGGGGAGGQPNVIPNGSSKGGGGGGGSGFGGCAAGVSYGEGDTNYLAASWGNPGSGGAGGVGGSTTTPAPTQTGGAGGGLGQNGADGESSTGGSPPTVGGTGGTAGYAIRGTSYLDGASGGYTTYGSTTP